MRTFVITLAAACLAAGMARADWLVRYTQRGSGIHVISVRHIPRNTAARRKLLRSIPVLLDEGPRHTSHTFYKEAVYAEGKLPVELRNAAEKTRQALEALSWPGSEVRKIVEQGPPANRINLTFVGDGYTAGEKARFFEDVARMAKDLFTGQTFASYLPLFNVYAVFVPSNESGLSDGDTKDTALGLRREPVGSKRAIMPGNGSAIERAIDLAPAADYPILLANDDYYGGLGGRYAITTRSVRSGNVVLRHELGHNFGQVGEEYDGGYVYSGANFSDSREVPWDYWSDGPVKVFDVLATTGAYAWKNLASEPYNWPFEMPEGGHVFYTLISSVGWRTPEDVEVTIDGKPIPLRGDWTDDRSFFQVGPTDKLPPGNHAFAFTERVHDRDNVLAYVRTYAVPRDYDFTPGRVGAFATFDDAGRMVGYRPTHASCLMRDMETKRFCPIDQENMWGRFLNKVDLIDAVEAADGVVTLKAPRLPGLFVRWYRLTGGGETELEDLRGQRSWKSAGRPAGRYRVRVKFETPEARRPTARFADSKEFDL